MATPQIRQELKQAGRGQSSRADRHASSTRRHRRPASWPEPSAGASTAYDNLAAGLGWFSIGLGLAELLVPRSMDKLVGAEKEHPILTRLLGAREIMAGLGILVRRRPAAWLWSRVAGDAMDLALLGGALISPGSRRERVLMATAAVAGVTALDVICSQQISARPGSLGPGERLEDGRIHVEKTITVNKPVEEVYQFWQNFENFPRFMLNLEKVERLDGNRSRWIAHTRGNIRTQWDAETIEDRPNERIAWRTMPGAAVEHSGAVSFSPATGGHGTTLRIDLRYRLPGGAIAALAGRLFGANPEQQVREDVRRFKQLIETGEIPTIKGQASGRGRDQ